MFSGNAIERITKFYDESVRIMSCRIEDDRRRGSRKWKGRRLGKKEAKRENKRLFLPYAGGQIELELG